MIEIYKLPKLDKSDLQMLNYINPWWEKRINKLIHKNIIWMQKFSIKTENYFLKTVFTTSEYNELFSCVNNMQNFIGPKFKQIKQFKRMLKKFQKFISQYMTLVGYCWSIYFMIEYYKQFNTTVVESKRKLAVNIFNEKNYAIYDRFKSEIKKIITDREALDIMFKLERFNQIELFDPTPIIKDIISYSLKLLKAKKLEEKDYLDIVYYSIIFTSFNGSSKWNYTIFINQLI